MEVILWGKYFGNGRNTYIIEKYYEIVGLICNDIRE